MRRRRRWTRRNYFKHLRLGDGAVVTAILRRERSEDFHRLRRSQMYAKRRDDIKSVLHCIGTFIGSHSHQRDLHSRISLSMRNRFHRAWLHVDLSKRTNVVRVKRLNLKLLIRGYKNWIGKGKLANYPPYAGSHGRQRRR